MNTSALLAALVLISGVARAQAHDSLRQRAPVNLPEVPGYVTLKCDFHIHTVFSDGLV